MRSFLIAVTTLTLLASGAAQAKVEEEPAPGFRREPLDIPRFLNRQNNQ